MYTNPNGRNSVLKTINEGKDIKTIENLRMPVRKRSEHEPSLHKRKLIVKRGNTFVPIEISNIALFYFQNSVSYCIDFSGNKYLIDSTLSDIEILLDPQSFFRVNRQAILNADAIKEFRSIGYGKLSITLVSNLWLKEDLVVSQLTAPLFKEWLDAL